MAFFNKIFLMVKYSINQASPICKWCIVLVVWTLVLIRIHNKGYINYQGYTYQYANI